MTVNAAPNAAPQGNAQGQVVQRHTEGDPEGDTRAYRCAAIEKFSRHEAST